MLYEIEKKYLCPRTFLTRVLENTEIEKVEILTNFYLEESEGKEHRVRKVEGSEVKWYETFKSKGLGIREESETEITEEVAHSLFSLDSPLVVGNSGVKSILRKNRYSFVGLPGVFMDDIIKLSGSYLVEVEVISEEKGTDPLKSQPEWFTKLLYKHSLDVTNDIRMYGRNLAIDVE